MQFSLDTFALLWLYQCY